MNEVKPDSPAKGGLETLQEIKQMMERSSRFISLSGISGIVAGLCALAGAWTASEAIKKAGLGSGFVRLNDKAVFWSGEQYATLRYNLLVIAATTFIAALVSSFIFTYLRSKKTGTPIWGVTARRVMFNVAMPMVTGGIFLLALLQAGHYEFIAPGSLVFYGLALVNASKYTLSEVRYLGYCEIILGLADCWLPGYSLLFWAIGFGILHIIYGTIMWMRYERYSQG